MPADGSHLRFPTATSYQLKHDMGYTRGAHSFKWGAELRFNRDSTIFGTNPNGLYTFGGGTAYSPS